ncbi:MAG: protoheme IX farnesyltransferase [Xanthomonadales bacterium]|nr:protoheme IX farnesyltransferase [Xanthomonadales bacterium]
MNTVCVTTERSAVGMAREVLSLFKLRIGFLIMITAVVGYVATPGHASVLQVLVMALATLVASAAAGAFNHYHEYRSDRLMARTRTRPFASGTLPHHPAWLLLFAGMLLAAVAAAWQVVNPQSAIFVFLGAFFYAVIYTVWLKRRSWTNIIIGGLAGSFAVLAGAAAADPQLGPLPWLFALVLFLWTPPHFWSLAIANREDYAAAGIPMLPVVFGPQRAASIVFASTVALVVASLLPAAFGAGPVYLVGAAAGGAWFILKSWHLKQVQNRKTAIASFLASLVQLNAVLVAACVDAML